MRVVISRRELNGKAPAFANESGVIFVEKGYADFNTYYYHLNFETGVLSDHTAIVTDSIQKCIDRQQLSPNRESNMSDLLGRREPVLWTNYNEPEAWKHNFTQDVGRYYLLLNPEKYLRVNKRIVEALILTMTGEIDGDQFVKGVLAANPAFGLSENQLNLLKSSKITRIYTGGIKIETGARIVSPSEFYLIR